MTQSPSVRLLTEANAATDAANPASPLGAALSATYGPDSAGVQAAIADQAFMTTLIFGE